MSLQEKERRPFNPWAINDLIDKKCCDNNNIPEEYIDFFPKKKLEIEATMFESGSICGHDIEHRSLVCDTRRRRNFKSHGLTVQPKVPPTLIKLRC